tara:strand:+ start:842 stop:1429 length:588 start_codon:yes stop_codon:yes gene_type:complete
MAILRAGPYYNGGIFDNEPSTPSSSFLPVNCAKDTSSANWRWKCYVNVNGSDNDTEGYSSGFQSISRSKEVPLMGPGEDIDVSILFYFYVQCSSAITFTVNYDLEATSPAYPFSVAGVGVHASGGSGSFGDYDSVSDDEGDLDGTSLTASVSGSGTITVPKSIKPQLVTFSAYAGSGGNVGDATGAGVSLSLSFN